MADTTDTKKPVGPRRRNDHLDPSADPRYANIPVQPEQPSVSERVFSVLWEIAKTLGFIILAAVLIRAFVVQPFFVQGESMEPNFHEEDYLLVNQFSYHFSQPRRGDVIIFKAPPEPDTNYIKRIIGLPGETVELKDGRFTVTNGRHPQGVVVEESYLAAGQRSEPESEQTRWQLADQQYFVVGDNRDPGKSSDSRAWGPVPRANIIGRAWVRVYPLDAVGGVKHQKFPELSLLLETSRAVVARVDG